MITLHRINIWICIIFFVFNAYGQTDRISFETFGSDQGMSNSFCKTIMEDSQGFIWVGTIDGLNRFDGYTFKTFQHNPEDSLSISGNHITALYEDAYGYIWVGTQKYGLNRLDPRTGNFLRFELDSLDGKIKYHRSILSIYQDSDLRMWVGTVNGILYLEDYDPENPALNNWRCFLVDKPNMAMVGGGYDFIEEGNGLWIATTFKMKYYDCANDKFYLFHLGLPESAKNNPFIINKLVRRKDDEIWLASRQEGLIQTRAVIDSGIPQVEFKFVYEPGPIDPKEVKLSSGYILDAVFTNKNQVWIGTGDGLDHLKLEEQQITYYKSKDKGGPAANAIYDMLEDRYGNLWLATEFGLNFWGKASKKFFSMSAEEGLAGKAMNGFYIENDSILWIASSQGLNRVNRVTGKTNSYITEKNQDVDGVNTFMTDVYEGPGNNIWVVSRDSIRLVDISEPENIPLIVHKAKFIGQRGMRRKDFLFSHGG
jgi:ligand-binding sensor domain-containing protein